MTLVREYQPTFVLGDGVTKEFSYLFEEVSENFIKVIVKHDDESTYVPVYSVDLDSHKVVFGDSEPAPLDTDVICIYRETPDLQDTPFRTLQGYDARALENILTKIVAMIQELKANGFSTQILQGYPWQLDLLNPVDDSASVVIDYNARILKKGLYFRIQGGNLQVSSDGSSFITMPKSSDILEFRQQHIVYPDLTTDDYLEYRIGNQWFSVNSDFDTRQDLLNHLNDMNNPHQVTKEQVGLGDCDNTSDADKPISTATQDALDDLQDEIDSLKGLGRFLSVWNCATGLAETNPPESPYTYNSGDYFLVGTVDSTTNYKPDGATYTTGVASTTVETNSVKVNDVYIYDGTTWKLQENSQRTVTFSAVAGSPYDNTNLASALNAKANATDIPTVNNPTIKLTQGGVTKGSFTLNQTTGDTIDLDAGGGGGLPDQTGQAGKFLTTDGTDASWSDKPLVNSSTKTNALAIGSNSAAGNYTTSIGSAAYSSLSTYGLCAGYNSASTGAGSVALGAGSHASALHSIQISSAGSTSAYNNDANTFKVANANGNYEMMSADGTIPEARLADTTSAAQGQVLTLDSNLDAVWANPTGGSGRNIGDTFMTKRTDTSLAGAVECDGATYNTTDFTGDGSIGELLEAGKLDYVSLSVYSTAISTKGWCDKIGWDGIGNTQFRVPTLNAYIVQTNNIPVDVRVPGSGQVSINTDSSGDAQKVVARGSFPYVIQANGGTTTSNTMYGMADLSDTAQLRVMIQVANSATDEALETCTSVLADVAGLKDMDNVTPTGKEVIAHNAMPSSNTQAITVGASGATYTAPADGYVVFTGLATAAGQFVYIGSPTFDNVAFKSSAVGNGEYIIFTIPVSKGQVFTVNYNLGGTKSLNFVYANGAQ